MPHSALPFALYRKGTQRIRFDSLAATKILLRLVLTVTYAPKTA